MSEGDEIWYKGIIRDPPGMSIGARCIRVVVASLEVTESRTFAVHCRVLECL